MSAMGYEQIGSMAELRDLLGVPTGRAPANYSRLLY